MVPKDSIGRALLIAGLGVVAVIGVHWMREASIVDACLDSGGSFDYVRMMCDTEQKHSYIGYGDRHPGAKGAVGAATVLLCAGLVLRRGASS